MEKVTTGEMNSGKGVIGTGPFKFVSWSPDDNVVVAKTTNTGAKRPPGKR